MTLAAQRETVAKEQEAVSWGYEAAPISPRPNRKPRGPEAMAREPTLPRAPHQALAAEEGLRTARAEQAAA
jgi:hypothetical protein